MSLQKLFAASPKSALEQSEATRARRRELARKFERAKQRYARRGLEAERERDRAKETIRRAVSDPSARAPTREDLDRLVQTVRTADRQRRVCLRAATRLHNVGEKLTRQNTDVDMMRAIALLGAATRELQREMPSAAALMAAGMDTQRQEFVMRERQRATTEAISSALHEETESDAEEEATSDREGDDAATDCLADLFGGGGAGGTGGAGGGGGGATVAQLLATAQAVRRDAQARALAAQFPSAPTALPVVAPRVGVRAVAEDVPPHHAAAAAARRGGGSAHPGGAKAAL